MRGLVAAPAVIAYGRLMPVKLAEWSVTSPWMALPPKSGMINFAEFRAVQDPILKCILRGQEIPERLLDIERYWNQNRRLPAGVVPLQ